MIQGIIILEINSSSQDKMAAVLQTILLDADDILDAFSLMKIFYFD